MATLSERLQAEIDRANSTTNKTDTTVHDAVGSLIEGYGVGGLEPVEYSWNQIPTAVKNYLENVTYDSSDYTTSRIAEFAPATADINNTYSIGKVVETSIGILDRSGYEVNVSNGNTMLYNDIPNQYTEYVNRNNGSISHVGTLKPTGFLRQVKCATINVRDLGGWACDGGTVKHGKLFRGGDIDEADIDIFVNQLGIRHELDLRGLSESNGKTESILGSEIGYTCPENYVWHSITDKTTWKEILRCVFDCVAENKPLFFHCAAGADRTGTVACMIEAILGMSQSDIDKEYELTNFAYGTSANAVQDRRRSGDNWKGQISAINALTVGSTFRDKVLNWVASLGFTVDEINSFRNSMINGTPDTITLSIGNHKITNTLTNVENSNAKTSITKYQPYNADITVPTGYVIESIKVTMGGVDVTASVFRGSRTNLNRAITQSLTNCTIDGKKAVIDGQDYVATIIANDGYTLEGGTVTITMGGKDMSSYYSDGRIAIPNVTGDIVINAVAVASAPAYTNLATTFKENYRINSSGGETANAGTVVVMDYIGVKTGDVVRIKGLGDLTGANTGYYLSNKTIISTGIVNATGMVGYASYAYDSANGIVTLTVLKDTVGYVRVSGKLTGTTADVIITKNEEIA